MRIVYKLAHIYLLLYGSIYMVYVEKRDDKTGSRIGASGFMMAIFSLWLLCGIKLCGNFIPQLNLYPIEIPYILFSLVVFFINYKFFSKESWDERIKKKYSQKEGQRLLVKDARISLGVFVFSVVSFFWIITA